MRIIGHRGARGEAPENTLGGFRYLRDIGVRAVEFDVRQLKDRCLTVIHDDNLARTTGVFAPLYECNEPDLISYDHRYHWKNWPDAEPTPKLNQVLQLMHDFEHIEVELKAVKNQLEAETLVSSLSSALNGFESQVTLTSFDEKILRTLKDNHSNLKRGLLVETNLKTEALDLACDLGCQHIGWMDELATDEMIKLSHQAKLSISVWTVNSTERAHKLRDQGIHGLITDIPKTMQSALA